MSDEEEMLAIAMKGVSERDVRVIELIGDQCRELENRTVLAPAVQPLAALLPEAKEAALAALTCRALANLCFENAENRAAVCRNEAALIYLGKSTGLADEENLKRNVTGLIANLVSEKDDAAAAVVANGGIEVLACSLREHSGLACRGLSNISVEVEWSKRALEAGVLPVLEELGDETAGQTILALAGTQAVALAVVQDTALFRRIVGRGWEGVLDQVCLHDAVAAIIGADEGLWKLLEPFPRCQGLVSSSDAGSSRALYESERLLAGLREAAAVEGETEEERKERTERRSGYLLALGNAARSEEAVKRLLGLDGLLETLEQLLEGATGDQHLATGLLGNVAVAPEGRETLLERHLSAQVALCLSKSFNAHVMMNCAVLLRRLALSETGRLQVALELPSLVEQRARLNQPEHVRIALEVARVLALCCGEESVNIDETAELLLKELLAADWVVLKIEACRGCALLARACPAPLIDDMLVLLIEPKSDPQLRYATLVALSKCALQKPEYLAALKAIAAEDPDAQVDGDKLTGLAKQMLASMDK